MWIHVPKEFCPSAPALGDLTKELSWRAQLLEQFVWSRGRATPSRSWLRAWKRGGWSRVLFGLMSEPSTAGPGVARWIASLPPIPASPFPKLAEAEEQPTHAISGQTLPASSPKSSHDGLSLKTSGSIYERASSKSTMTFAAWATALRRACLQRQKSAPRINGNGSSSWPTAGASDWKGSSRAGQRKGQLSEAAECLWATPVASPNTNRTTKHSPTHGNTHGVTLAGQACHFSHPDLTTSTAGEPSLPSIPNSRRRLNPLFVEWLMGLALTGSGLVAMASFRSVLRMRLWYLVEACKEKAA